MKKSEIYDELISLGFVEDALEGLLKVDLQDLLDDHTARETEMFINLPEPRPCGKQFKVTHLFATELWLCDGLRLFKKDHAELFQTVKINHRLRKEGDKWVKVN